MAKKSKPEILWGGYKTYTYLEGAGKEAKPVKFLARDDEDAQLYVKKIGATSWMKPVDLDYVKKEKYSNAGKGDKSRVTNKNKFDKNWEKIFKKKEKQDVGSSN